MSSAGISFSGLSSGIDTQSIIDQLIKLEQVPVQNMQDRKTREGVKGSILNDLSTRLQALRTAADALRDQTFWKGGPHSTSGDDKSYTLTATADSAKASYKIRVAQLASADVLVQRVTAGKRQFGSAYVAGGTFASGTAKLTQLTGSTGTSLGVAVGQTITLSGTQGGNPVTAAYTVTASSTVDDLMNWIGTAVPGATAKLDTGGRITVTSPPGTDQELTPGLSLSTGGAAPAFDAAFATSTAIASATGIGKVQADDTLHIVAGTLAFDVKVTAGMTMAQVAAAINATNGGANAAVVGGALRLAGKDTGAANQVAVTSAGSLAAQLNLNNTVQADDAHVFIDGIEKTSASNTTDELIPGATLDLLRTSPDETTGTTDPTYVDQADARGRVQKVIDSYNAVIDLIDLKVSEKPVKAPTTADEKNKGTLFGSTTLNQIRSDLQGALTGVVAGLVSGKNLPSDIGVSTGAIGSGVGTTNTGRLQFDASKFDALFGKDLDGLRQLLTTDGASRPADGLAQRVSDLCQSYTKTGGLLQAAIDGSTAEQQRLQDQIDRMQDRVTATQERLKAQFLAMETAIQQLRSQSSGIENLGNLSSGR